MDNNKATEMDAETSAAMDALFTEAGVTGFEVVWICNCVILASVRLPDWAAIKRAPKDPTLRAALLAGNARANKVSKWDRIGLYAVRIREGRKQRVLLYDYEKGASRGRSYLFRDEPD